jgi:hypothetical protein
MASLVTQSTREVLATALKTDVDGSGFYIGLARAETFTAGSNPSSLNEQRKIRHTLQSIKTVTGVSHVVPLVSWSSGAFNAYDDDLPSQTNYYVINSANEVFICLEQGKNPDGIVQNSTVEPTLSLQSAVHPNNPSYSWRTADQYLWRYLYKLSTLAISNFKSTSFFPVKEVTGSPSITEEVEQKSLQDSSAQQAGQILSLVIDDAGSGYTSSPTITIDGNGTGASFTCDVSGGVISRVRVDSAVGVGSHGTGYDFAKVNLSSGNAVLRAVIGPTEGLGAKPIEALRSKSLMMQTDFEGTETDTIVADNDFLQTVLLKDVTVYNSATIFSGNTGNALKALNITSGSAQTFVEDEIIEGGSSGAKAKVVHQKTGAPNHLIYFYQDEETGFTSFSGGGGETITRASDGAARGTTAGTPITDPDIDAYSGRLIHINTLGTAIDRQASQTEDAKIIITLG